MCANARELEAWARGTLSGARLSPIRLVRLRAAAPELWVRGGRGGGVMPDARTAFIQQFHGIDPAATDELQGSSYDDGAASVMSEEGPATSPMSPPVAAEPPRLRRSSGGGVT